MLPEQRVKMMLDSEKGRCIICKYFKTGHLDNHVNWLECRKGHLLISKDKLIHQHHPFRDEKQEKIRVTSDCWAEDNGQGEAMLERDDCPEYKKRPSLFSEAGNHL